MRGQHNLAILFYYKYLPFAVSNLDWLLRMAGRRPVALMYAALPIGVSFVVFEKITYLVDIARRISRPAPSFSRYLFYVLFFPKLLAGPIMKYHELEAQLLAFGRNQGGSHLAGWRRFMLGVVKKVLLADMLASGADMTYAADPATLGCADAWWGVLFFTLQIYIDFSAYTDMAIGLAAMFDFRLNENFNAPYISRSITEFWRRWHISLSTWIRDYLYIPLGGNRVPVWRRYANLGLCFLLSGLWHGAAWTYVAWGAYNGIFLIMDRLFLLHWLQRLPGWAAMGLTFLVTMAGWALFRAKSMTQAGTILAAMLHPATASTALSLWRTPPMYAAAGVAAMLSFLPAMPGTMDLASASLQTAVGRMTADLALSGLFIVALAYVLAAPFQPFLYFRF